MYVEVIIALALPKNYTWAVPERLQASICVGGRVEVILGKSKRYAGIVKKIVNQKPEKFTPKEIISVIDDSPIIYPDQLAFWEWIASYYLCTEGEVMQAAIPANLKLSSESILIWNEADDINHQLLTDKEFIVTEALSIKKELSLSEIQQLLDSTQVYPTIKKIIEKKIGFIWESLTEKYRPKMDKLILLTEKYQQEEELASLLNNWKRASKQIELLLAYLHLEKTLSQVTQTELLRKSNGSLAQLNALIEKGILYSKKINVDRIESLPPIMHLDFALSDAQQNSYHQINHIFESKKVCLLHGITASGKTEIYTKLIEDNLIAGKQVLYMLPEIALTSQIIRRLQKSFGGNIGIYHSKFNPNQRVEIWNKVKEGKTNIILGARSALFLPFKNLGLIIVDEEHDPSYKQQEPSPRYQARDASIYYAAKLKANIILGSATPSLESYFNASQDKYGLVKLTERYQQFSLPEITIIDSKLFKNKATGKVMISPPLAEAIKQSLEANKQIILFQNRRGYSPYFLCKQCGWIPNCNHCNVTLTYHKHKNQLSCHYCGSQYPIINSCEACGSQQFHHQNFGTEKIAESIAELFPSAMIARMDYDSVKGKNEHEILIQKFENRQIDILVGTQMVVKGLDFAHVNLVGIVDADGLFNFTDFRVNERAFQLMEQVSGRAGRKDGNGKVMIQVSNLSHPIIDHIIKHDYESFYQSEIHKREVFSYPPFSRLIKIICKHKDSSTAEAAAKLMAKAFIKQYPNAITGPAQPAVDRVRNKYLWEILIKFNKDAKALQQIKLMIQQQCAIVQSSQSYKSVNFVIDVDPN